MLILFGFRADTINKYILVVLIPPGHRTAVNLSAVAGPLPRLAHPTASSVQKHGLPASCPSDAVGRSASSLASVSAGLINGCPELCPCTTRVIRTLAQWAELGANTAEEKSRGGRARTMRVGGRVGGLIVS